MASRLKLKANPSIVVDYQTDRHDFSSHEEESPVADDGHSGLFYLAIWAISTGIFLGSVYIASEAAFPGKDAAPNLAVSAPPGPPALKMTKPRSTAKRDSVASGKVGLVTETRR